MLYTTEMVTVKLSNLYYVIPLLVCSLRQLKSEQCTSNKKMGSISESKWGSLKELSEILSPAFL